MTFAQKHVLLAPLIALILVLPIFTFPSEAASGEIPPAPIERAPTPIPAEKAAPQEPTYRPTPDPIRENAPQGALTNDSPLPAPIENPPLPPLVENPLEAFPIVRSPLAAPELHDVPLPAQQNAPKPLRAELPVPPLPREHEKDLLIHRPVSVATTTTQNDCLSGGDASDSMESATPIVPPVDCQGYGWKTSAANDIDAYRFTGTPGFEVTILLESDQADFDFCFGRLDYSDMGEPGLYDGSCEHHDFPADEYLVTEMATADDYVIYIWPHSGSGNYRLVVTVSPAQNDCGTGNDAGGDFADSALIYPPVNCNGRFPRSTLDDTYDFDDWYEYSGQAGTEVVITLSATTTSNFDACLYDQSESRIACSTYASGTDTITRTMGTTGQWRIHIYWTYLSGADADEYSLSVILNAPQNDCGTGGDAGDSFNQAFLITLPVQNCSASLQTTKSDHEDWYRFSVVAGGSLDAILSPNAAGDFDMCLYTPSQSKVRCSSTYGKGLVERFDGVGISATGEYRLRIYATSGTGAYTLSVSYKAPGAQNDCGTGGDAGDTFAQATFVTPKSCTGTLPNGGERDDFYRFTVYVGQTITASMKPPAYSDFDLCLFRPDGTRQGCSQNTGSNLESRATVADQTGEWRVQIWRFTGYGDYKMTLTLSALHDDCYRSVDAGNHGGEALSIGGTTDCPGSFPTDTGDSEDWYTFTFNIPQATNIRVTPNTNADYDVCLYRPDSSQAACSTLVGSGRAENIFHNADASGTWTLRLYAVNGSGTYSMSLATAVPQTDCGTDGDAGDWASLARVITPPTDCQGAFPAGSTETEDWYSFSVASGRAIDAALTMAGSLDADLCIYPAGSGEGYCSRLQGQVTESVSYTASNEATYYVRVIADLSTRGNYTLAVTISDTPQDDCGTGRDAGGSFSYAQGIGTPASCQGKFNPITGDVEDWYRFPVDVGHQVTAAATPPTGMDLDLCLYKPNGAEAQCSRIERDSPEAIAYTATTAGEWRLRLLLRPGIAGESYTLSVALSAPQNDCLTAGDAGGAFSSAARVAPPLMDCAGKLLYETGDTEDWYKFTADANTQVHATLTPLGGDFDLCLYKPDGNQAACSSQDGTARDPVSHLTGASGDWRLRVYRTTGTGEYTLSLSLTGPENDCGTGRDAPITGYEFPPAISAPAACTGEFRSPDAEDWYAVHGTPGTTLAVSMSPNADADFDLCVSRALDPGSDECHRVSGPSSEIVLYEMESDDDYMIRIYVVYGTGIYTLQVHAETSQADCGIQGDAGDSFSYATLVVPPVDCDAALPIGTLDQEDWYKLPVQSGSAIEAAIMGGDDLDLCVYSPTNEQVACSTQYDSSDEHVSVFVDATGEWRVRVYRDYGSGGAYSLNIAVLTGQNDCGTGKDAPDAGDSAVLVNLPVSCEGAFPFDWGDPADWYRFSVTAGSALNARITPPIGSDYDVCFYDNPAHSPLRCGTATTGDETVGYKVTSTNTYYLRVIRPSGSGAYGLAIKTVLPQTDCGTGDDAAASRYSTPPLLSPPLQCQAEMRPEEGDTEDWYWFSAYSGQTVTIRAEPLDTGGDIDVCLYRPNGEEAACSTFTNVRTETLTETLPTAGAWQIRIYQVVGASVYTLAVSLADVSPNDCRSSSEAGNTFVEATPISPPTDCMGDFRPGSGDTEDFYKVYVDAAAFLAVTLERPVDATFRVCLYDPTNVLVSCSTSPTLQQEVSVTTQAAGMWRVRVVTTEGFGDYRLIVRAPLPAGDDFNLFEFEDDAEDWTSTGLWHLAFDAASPYANSLSAPAAFWFGREDTGTYEGGLGATSGTLTSPEISLIGVPNPMLAFASWYQTEDEGPAHDGKRVLISIDNGTTWTLLSAVYGDADYGQWAVRYVDVSSYANQVVRLRFEFDSSDALYNNYRGWYVDDVRLFRDDDHDGLSTEEEIALESDPMDSDTDDDGVIDVMDIRPTVEDVQPFFPYVPGQSTGEVKFYTTEGFVDVDLKAPADNAGGGVAGVSIGLHLEGVVGNSQVEASVRFDLTPNATTGNYQGRMPLPRNFQGGRATSESFAVTVVDIHGNERTYAGVASEVMDFGINWNAKTDPEFHTLRQANIQQSTDGTTTFTASSYSFDPLDRGQQPAKRTYRGVVGPGESGDVGLAVIASPRDPPVVAPPPVAHNALKYVGSSFVSRQTALAFAGGVFTSIWEGVKWGWEEVVAPEAQSFIFGSDSNGHVFGDIISGLLIYGDVRDVVVGLYEGDDVQFMIGCVGLALTFTPLLDAAFSAAKAAIKAVPPALARVLVDDLMNAISRHSANPVALADEMSRVTRIAIDVGSDVSKANGLARISNALPGKHVMLDAVEQADYKALEKAAAKYSDDVFTGFGRDGSHIAEGEWIVQAAVAESKGGGDAVRHASLLADQKGVAGVLNNLAKAPPHSAKGYAFELKKGADLLAEPGTQSVAFGERFTLTGFTDSKGVYRTTVEFRPDVVRVSKTAEGTLERTVYELKDKNKVYAGVGMKNQLLKLNHYVRSGAAHDAVLIVKNGEAVNSKTISFANGLSPRVKVLDDTGRELT